MKRRDDNGLEWSGRPKEHRPGGLVDGVGLNERTHQLAVDPDAVVQPEACAGRKGTHLTVERLGDDGGAPVQRNGRVRMTPT